MADTKYVIGLDYGTDSARALVVETATGRTVATSVKYYPRWKKGLYCAPLENKWRQHPLDYIEVLEASVKEALSLCPSGTAENVIGMSFDTTGSTPVFVDETGTPLALLPEFAENPNAMFVLWKDHTAVKEAAEINEACHRKELSTIQHTKAASILQSGGGQRYSMFSERTKPYVMRLVRLWSIATGCLPSSQAASQQRTSSAQDVLPVIR